MAFEDTFARADGPLGSPWVEFSDGTATTTTWGIDTNRAVYMGDILYPGHPDWPGDPAVNTTSVGATVDVGSPNMAVEWDSIETTNVRRHIFRYKNPTSWLAVASTGGNRDTMYLVARNGGTTTTLATTTVTGWQQKRVRVEAVGTQIDVYVDGTHAMTATSSHNLTETRAGIAGMPRGYPGGTFTDNFTRADASTLGAPWTEHSGTWGIDTNRAVYLTPMPAGTNIRAATIDLKSPIQTVEWEWTALEKGPSYHAFRYQDINNFWFVSGTGSPTTTMYLFQRSGGTSTIRATATGVTWGPGYRLRIEAGASKIEVFSDSTKVISHTVTAPVNAATRAGISGNAASGGGLNLTRWTRFWAEGQSIDYETFPQSVDNGVRLTGLHWTRFWASKWPIRKGSRLLGCGRGRRG